MWNIWNALLRRYWQVAIFKESPANTPYSVLLLGIVSFLYFILTLLQWEISGLQKQLPFKLIILLALGLLFVYSSYTFLILYISGKKNRFVQTLTALITAHFIIHLIAFPLIVISPQLLGVDVDPNMNSLLALAYIFMTLSLTVWQFLVTAFIYRKALEIDLLSSLLASFGLSLCNILIALLL